MMTRYHKKGINEQGGKEGREGRHVATYLDEGAVLVHAPDDRESQPLHVRVQTREGGREGGREGR